MIVALVVLISVIMVISQAFAASDVGSPTTSNYNATTGCPGNSCTIQNCNKTTCVGSASSDCLEGTVCGPATQGTCKSVPRVPGSIIYIWICV
jgi:hypothetical protein